MNSKIAIPFTSQISSVSIDKLILAILSLSLLIDSIYGFLVLKGINTPLLVAFKTLTTALLFSRLFFLSRTKWTLILFAYSYACIDALYLFFLYQNPKNSLAIFVFLSKIIYPILVLLYTSEILRKDPLIKNIIIKIFYISYSIIWINILLGLAGFGDSVYEAGIGAKGFFFAGNEMSVTYIVIPSFLLYHRIVSNQSYKLFTFFMILGAFIIVMKVAVLGVLITSVFVFIIGKIDNNERVLTIPRVIIFSIIMIAIILGGYFVLDYVGAFSRWRFFYKKMPSLLTFILSTRDLKFIIQLKHILRNHYPNFLFLGIGDTNYPVEIDPIDIFFILGSVGFILIYGFYFLFNVELIKKIICFRNNLYLKYICFLNGFLLLISLLAGHVMSSTMAGFFIGMINGFIVIKEQKEQREIP